MTDPIQSAYIEMMNQFASALDAILNPGLKGDDRTVAFTLLITNFGKIDNGRVNYISNANREDVVAMMKELMARWEGRYVNNTGDTQ